ncbi:TVP38/TMEM64 family protein [Haladaptatus sp. DYSN1]|uniref:TVP38/TMEM64 family protein n=1 Tax=unclassified Haladaptatus TaxID=2622732 RepID=UPI00240650D2|nr:VTT domain-containing protein [Haladaptatus sp. DYSN1]
MDRATRRQLVGIALVGSAILVASLVFSPRELFTAFARLTDDPVRFAVVLALAYLLRPLVAWPVTPLSIVVGYVYGVTVGIPIALVGIVVTAVPPFFLARYFPENGIIGKARDVGSQFFSATGETRGVIASRLIPIPTDIISYSAGLAGVRTWPFVVGTLVGEAPWAIAGVLAGNSMETLTTEGVSGVGLPVVLGAAALAFLLVAGPLLRRLHAAE